MSYVIPYRCVYDHAPTCTNGFTLGKKYKVIGRCNNTVTVHNDNLHERVIIPMEKSPHITYQSPPDMLGAGMLRSVGYFYFHESEDD